jgi:probable HAF family extracellular repeat protein/T5SS/PEP-CTERM-associated repeat protein
MNRMSNQAVAALQSLRLATVAVAVLLAGSVNAIATEDEASFEGLGMLPGHTRSHANAISADGSIVVGSSWIHNVSPDLQEAFRWEDGTMVGLGNLGAQHSQAYAVDGDGTVIVGRSHNGEVGQWTGIEAFRWQIGGGMQGLGFLEAGAWSEATGVSADGSVIVGFSRRTTEGTDPMPEAFRWADGAMVGIGTLPGYGWSSAAAISAGGSVIVGWVGGLEGNFRAFRWEADEMVDLGVLPGNTNARATATSDDGTVVVGRSYGDGPTEAFRWENGDMVSLGRLPEATISWALAVSGDGSVVVGYNNNPIRASIWTSETGMLSLQDVLVQGYGLDLEGWTLREARGISADGRTIVGIGDNPDGQQEGWIVYLPRIETGIYFWEGLSGDFADETNWEPTGVPGVSSLAIFDKDQGYTVTFGDEESARVFVERGYVVFSGGSYTLGGGSLESPSLSVGNDAADQANVHLMHGHQLETTFATLGRQSNNQGTLQVSGVGQPTHWRSQGRLTVGEAGQGTVQVVLGGTLDADEVIIGQESGAQGHLEITAVGAIDEPTVTLGSVAIGWSGSGFLDLRREVGDEPLVPLVTGAAIVGVAADGGGSVTMSDGYWQVAELVIGESGYGLVQLQGLNFVTVTGGEPTVLGHHSTGVGTLSMTGEDVSLADLKNVIVGRRGQGQILIEAGSLLVDELQLGEQDAAEGEVRIMGTEGILGVRQTVIVGAGSSGANRLWLGPGSLGIVEGSILVGVLPDEDPIETAKDGGSGETDVLLVEGAQLTIHDGLVIGGTQVLDSGFPSGAMVLQMVGIVETAELIVNGGGAVLGQGTIELTGGLPAIVTGMIAPGVVVWQRGDGDGGDQKQSGPPLRRS